MTDRGRSRRDPIEAAVESLLRTIPERWTDFDHDALAATEQRALFLLVAAGLVERRIGVRGEFAGQRLAVEFTIDATGEYGLVEAMEPVSETPAGTAGNEGFGDGDAEVEVPPLTENEVAVITTLARFDPMRLASVAMIEAEMDAGSRRSPRKIGEAVNRLIELGFAERPRGARSGVRLTTAGRRVARKIAD